MGLIVTLIITDTQHNDTKHKLSIGISTHLVSSAVMPRVTFFIVMLSIILLNVVILNVVAPWFCSHQNNNDSKGKKSETATNLIKSFLI